MLIVKPACFVSYYVCCHTELECVWVGVYACVCVCA